MELTEDEQKVVDTAMENNPEVKDNPGKGIKLTKDEKKLIVIALKRHLEEVKQNEKLKYQQVQLLAVEKKYEEFVEDIIKKLS
ncbi:hypothetical protein ACFL0W_04530 [Nanoarchaeota archaeon]